MLSPFYVIFRLVPKANREMVMRGTLSIYPFSLITLLICKVKISLTLSIELL